MPPFPFRWPLTRWTCVSQLPRWLSSISETESPRTNGTGFTGRQQQTTTAYQKLSPLVKYFHIIKVNRGQLWLVIKLDWDIMPVLAEVRQKTQTLESGCTITVFFWVFLYHVLSKQKKDNLLASSSSESPRSKTFLDLSQITSTPDSAISLKQIILQQWLHSLSANCISSVQLYCQFCKKRTTVFRDTLEIYRMKWAQQHTYSRRGSFWINGTWFLQASCPSCQPTHDVNVLKEMTPGWTNIDMVIIINCYCAW